MSTQNALWWTIVQGQLKEGEDFGGIGSPDKNVAEKEAERMRAAGVLVTGVKLLETVESFQELGTPGRTTFPSTRWCVLVQDDGLRAELDAILPNVD